MQAAIGPNTPVATARVLSAGTIAAGAGGRRLRAVANVGPGAGSHSGPVEIPPPPQVDIEELNAELHKTLGKAVGTVADSTGAGDDDGAESQENLGWDGEAGEVDNDEWNDGGDDGDSGEGTWSWEDGSRESGGEYDDEQPRPDSNPGPGDVWYDGVSAGETDVGDAASADGAETTQHGLDEAVHDQASTDAYAQGYGGGERHRDAGRQVQY